MHQTQALSLQTSYDEGYNKLFATSKLPELCHHLVFVHRIIGDTSRNTCGNDTSLSPGFTLGKYYQHYKNIALLPYLLSDMLLNKELPHAEGKSARITWDLL